MQRGSARRVKMKESEMEERNSKRAVTKREKNERQDKGQ